MTIIINLGLFGNYSDNSTGLCRWARDGHFITAPLATGARAQQQIIIIDGRDK
jgi:hypothetical protein